MKRILPLFILVLSCLSTAHAQYINIGSTKQEVKNIQGEPTSAEAYEEFEEEVWRYGETGIATITFKNDKIKGFRNYNRILKIGDISKKPTKSEKPKSREELWKYLNEKAKTYEPKAPNAYGEDKSGMYGSSSQNIKTFPKEYEEMAEANGLNPYAMPDEITLQRMQKEYDRKNYLKWGLISLGVTALIFILYKIFKKNK
nr:hypothetical protein [uncultured Chryseobacterium sp.]